MENNICCRKTHYFLLFLLSLVLLAGCSLPLGSGKTNVVNSKKVPVDNPQLEKEYEKAIAEILNPVWEENNFDGIRDKILEIKTPAKYLELHLGLVLALDLIQQGRLDSDQAKIEQGLEKLTELKNQYKWLD